MHHRARASLVRGGAALCLLVADDAGVKIGTPVLDGVKAKAKVVEHGKGKKVIVFKYKPKKNIRTKRGHRQPYTKVEILSIG